MKNYPKPYMLRSDTDCEINLSFQALQHLVTSLTKATRVTNSVFAIRTLSDHKMQFSVVSSGFLMQRAVVVVDVAELLFCLLYSTPGSVYTNDKKSMTLRLNVSLSFHRQQFFFCSSYWGLLPSTSLSTTELKLEHFFLLSYACLSQPPLVDFVKVILF